ncbi:MAG: DNA-methyltransferase [Betaproteobacteria bacterium]|jgi:site-specific DNA-methyltransferase (cytosine-N4-specific)
MRVASVAPPSAQSLDDSTIFEGDALNALASLPDESIQCAVTSPPYWGLRDYGIAGQIGLEESLSQYINRLVAVFAQVGRVLRPDGTLWLNVGDGFTSGNRGYRAPDRKNAARAMSIRPDTPDGLKPKDLLGVPWRLAFALQEDGWFLRSDVVWHKPNAMPESVKDRPTRAHEYLFLLSRSERYYYDHHAVREPTANNQWRARRSVWNVPTQTSGVEHFAAFPPALIEPCILSSSRPGDFVLDPFFGSGTVGLVCQRLGRRFVGIELNPRYVQIAIERIGLFDPRVVRLLAA